MGGDCATAPRGATGKTGRKFSQANCFDQKIRLGGLCRLLHRGSNVDGMYVLQCLCLYWVYSSVYGLVQFVLLRLPTVRRTLRMTQSSADSSTPLRDTWRLLRNKYRF